MPENKSRYGQKRNNNNNNNNNSFFTNIGKNSTPKQFTHFRNGNECLIKKLKKNYRFSKFENFLLC